MPDLKIQLQESIKLPTSDYMIMNTTTVIPGVNQIVRHVDTVSNKFKNKGVEILRLVDEDYYQVA